MTAEVHTSGVAEQILNLADDEVTTLPTRLESETRMMALPRIDLRNTPTWGLNSTPAPPSSFR